MSIIKQAIGSVLRRVVEKQARGRGFRDLAGSLAESGDDLALRMRDAPDTPDNREAVQHIVGIERWGQRRLRVALGEPFVLDGHRPYRPAEDAPLRDLCEAFVGTRSDTVALARELEAEGVDAGLQVRHNDLGELTLGAWLAYLDGHARREARRLSG